MSDSDTTPNLGLVKASPASPDPLSTRVDGNLDLIDAAVGALQGGGGGLGAFTYSAPGGIPTLTATDGVNTITIGGLFGGAAVGISITGATRSLAIAYQPSGAVILEFNDGTYSLQFNSTSGGFVLAKNSTGYFEVDLDGSIALQNTKGNAGDVITSQGTGEPAIWSGPVVKQATVAVSTSQIENLHSAPVQLLPAPGAGKMIVVLSSVIEYVHGSTPFTVDGTATLAIPFGGLTANQTGFLDQSSNQVYVVAAGGNGNFTAQVNQPVNLSNGSAAEASAGDGSLSVTVTYMVVPVS